MAMRRSEAAAAPAPDDGIDFSSVNTLTEKDKNVKIQILVEQFALFLRRDPARRISKRDVAWFELGVNQNSFLNRCITQCEGITDAQRDSLFELTEEPLDQLFFDFYFDYGEDYVEKESKHKDAVLKWAAKHGYTTKYWHIEPPDFAPPVAEAPAWEKYPDISYLMQGKYDNQILNPNPSSEIERTQDEPNLIKYIAEHDISETLLKDLARKYKAKGTSKIEVLAALKMPPIEAEAAPADSESIVEKNDMGRQLFTLENEEENTILETYGIKAYERIIWFFKGEGGTANDEIRKKIELTGGDIISMPVQIMRYLKKAEAWGRIFAPEKPEFDPDIQLLDYVIRNGFETLDEAKNVSLRVRDTRTDLQGIKHQDFRSNFGFLENIGSVFIQPPADQYNHLNSAMNMVISNAFFRLDKATFLKWNPRFCGLDIRIKLGLSPYEDSVRKDAKPFRFMWLCGFYDGEKNTIQLVSPIRKYNVNPYFPYDLEDLKKMSVAQLKTLLEKQNLEEDGEKDELIERLSKLIKPRPVVNAKTFINHPNVSIYVYNKWMYNLTSGHELLKKNDPLLDELARQMSYPKPNRMKYMTEDQKDGLTRWITTKDIEERLQSARRRVLDLILSRRSGLAFVLANQRLEHAKVTGEGDNLPQLPPEEITRIIARTGHYSYEDLPRDTQTTGLMVPTWRCGLTLGPTRQDDHVSRATAP